MFWSHTEETSKRNPLSHRFYGLVRTEILAEKAEIIQFLFTSNDWKGHLCVSKFGITDDIFLKPDPGFIPWYRFSEFSHEIVSDSEKMAH
jgi:hypothetical protein